MIYVWLDHKNQIELRLKKILIKFHVASKLGIYKYVRSASI